MSVCGWSFLNVSQVNTSKICCLIEDGSNQLYCTILEKKHPKKDVISGSGVDFNINNSQKNEKMES